MEEKNKEWEMERGREIKIYVHIYMFTYTKHGRIMSPLLCHILFLIFDLHPISVSFAFGSLQPFFLCAMVFKPVYIHQPTHSRLSIDTVLAPGMGRGACNGDSTKCRG